MRFTNLSLLLALGSTAFASPVEKRQSFSSDTENGLSGACKAYTVIFARGTTELGNVGSVAGPPFFEALATLVGSGNLAVQGVTYAADIPGFLAGGDATGSSTMASLVEQAFTQCPDTKLVISGYSQGGQLVHNAAKLLSSTIAGKITAAVIFGDPDDGEAVQGVSAARTKIICHTGDDICLHGDLILLAHLTYGQDASTAANFVVSVSG